MGNDQPFVTTLTMLSEGPHKMGGTNGCYVWLKN